MDLERLQKTLELGDSEIAKNYIKEIMRRGEPIDSGAFYLFWTTLAKRVFEEKKRASCETCKSYRFTFSFGSINEPPFEESRCDFIDSNNLSARALDHTFTWELELDIQSIYRLDKIHLYPHYCGYYDPIVITSCYHCQKSMDVKLDSEGPFFQLCGEEQNIYFCSIECKTSYLNYIITENR